jgi:glycine cleavage system transcriptional repressor
MNSYIVMTAVGPDRPGIVDEISAFLSDRRVNIEDSHMAVLGGEFAVILLGSGEDRELDTLKNDMPGLEHDTGLSIQIRKTSGPGGSRESVPHRLSATSMDHPGIVHEISRVLHRRNVNIRSLETRVGNAPVSGAPIFNMRAIIDIPADQKPSSIRHEIDELGDRMDIDIEIEAVDTFI